MNRILLAEPLDADAEARLAARGTLVRPLRSDESGLIDALADCVAIVARTHTPLTRAVIQAGRSLRVIGVAGVGLDRVDLEAARQRGIEVVHTPAAASDAVAELTIAFMLELLRPIRRLSAEYADGGFKSARATAHGHELRDRTVGIVGMGRIGSRVGRIVSSGFGGRVLYCDIADVGPFPFAVQRVELQDVLAESDFVTLHVPVTSQTRGMMGQAALHRMKRDAMLINTARGAVVDTAALLDAVATGRLAGAALDVTEPEPLALDHPLFRMPQVILTPHIAARTVGGLNRMCAVVDQVIARLAAQ